MPASAEVRAPLMERTRDRTTSDSLEREHASQERKRQNDPQPWNTVESLSITKQADGSYKAQIDFRNEDKQLLHREYAGTRDEIRKAIEKDKELPKEERQHLLRSLDQEAPQCLGFILPRAFRDFFDFDAEYFNWPHLDF